MISFIVTLLVFLIIAAILLYTAKLVIESFGPPKPIYNLAYALVILLLLSVFLNEVGFVGHPHAWRNF